MWIKRIVCGAAVALGFAFGGAATQAGGVGHQPSSTPNAGHSSNAPLITLVRGGHGGFHGAGFHGGAAFRGGFHGAYRGGFAGYRGRYLGYRGAFAGYRGPYVGAGVYRGYYPGWYGARRWNYANWYGGNRWNRWYANNYYGYYGYYGGYWGYPAYSGYYDWPFFTGIGLTQYRYTYNTTSCYRICRATHGPRYCRRYAQYYRY